MNSVTTVARQSSQAEQAAVDDLRRVFQEAHRAAEKAAHALAIALPIGREREWAFDVFEKVRVATRRAV